MKKKLLYLLLLIFQTTFILGFSYNNKNTEIVRLKDISFIINEDYSIENHLSKMSKDIEIINKLYVGEEWFIEYKKILSKYKQYITAPKTIYDVFLEEELDLLFKVVQAEVGDEWEFANKTNVASVIFNRMYSDEYDFKNQNIIQEVLTEKQFSSIKDGRYKNIEVSKTTILACEYVYMFGDTTNGCTAFRSDDNPEKWCKWEYSFFDGAHYFYK